SAPPCCSRDAKHPCCMPCVLLGTRHCRRRSAQGSLHQYPELAHREGRARTRGMVRLPHRLRTSAGGRCLPGPSASPPLLGPTIPRAVPCCVVCAGRGGELSSSRRGSAANRASSRSPSRSDAAAVRVVRDPPRQQLEAITS